MKKIYIAHPFQGKRSNKQAITAICKTLAGMNIMPVSPVHAFDFLCDDDPPERELAIKFCHELLWKCDEMWLFADWEKSAGCQSEIATAMSAAIPVRVVKGWFEDIPLFSGRVPEWVAEIRAEKHVPCGMFHVE